MGSVGLLGKNPENVATVSRSRPTRHVVFPGNASSSPEETSCWFLDSFKLFVELFYCCMCQGFEAEEGDSLQQHGVQLSGFVLKSKLRLQMRDLEPVTRSLSVPFSRLPREVSVRCARDKLGQAFRTAPVSWGGRFLLLS